MISFLRPIQRLAGAAIVTATLSAASGWMGPAIAAEGMATERTASESIVAATLAADAAAADGAAILAARATPLRATDAPANKTVGQGEVSKGPARPGVEKTAYDANAAMATTRRRAGAPQYERRLAPTRTSDGCSGIWCGRHFVLMLGVAY